MKLRLAIGRTLTPKQYNSIRLDLELSEDLGALTPEQLDTRINLFYKTIKEKLNQIEEYETQRLLG